MKTITIEADRKNGPNGDQYLSTAPDGYVLSSVQTVSHSASYLLVLHTYVPNEPTSSPSEAETERRVDLLIELEPVCGQTEDPEIVRRQLRCVAIRQLLAERGAK
jgi:hypothetical protein